MTIPGFAPFQYQNINDELVAIISIDTNTRMAQGLTRHRDNIKIRWDVPVGGVYVTPAVGDQWYVTRLDNSYWKLATRVPFNDNNTLIEPVQGQMIIGGTGPVELNGSQTNAHGDLNVDGALGVGAMTLKEVDGTLQQSADGGATWAPVGSGSGSGIDDITGLTEALAGKADLVDGKVPLDQLPPMDTGPIEIDDITGLSDALDGKASTTHTHSEDEITNLVVDLAGKAAVDHTHSVDGAALDPDLVDIGALTPIEKDLLQYRSDHWVNRTPAQLKSDLLLSFPDITGILAGGQIPGLDASKIISGIFGAGAIPGLDVSKIISGIFPTGMIPSLDASKIGSGQFLSGLIPGLDATKIVSGILGLTQIPTLDSLHIPLLDASKIGSGTLLSTLIPGLDAAKIVSGIFGTGQIPGLDAGKITSGQFPQSMLNITSIAASIISGALGLSNIPGLPTSKITSGIFPQSMLDITNIAGSIISGVLGTAQIPGLDTTKIVSGTFAQSFVSGLPIIGALLGNTGLQQAGSNLVHSPNLETATLWPGTDASTDFRGAMSTDFAHSGTQSRKLTATASTQNFCFLYNPTTATRNDIACNAGDKFTVGYWYYIPFTNLGTNVSAVRIAVGYIDSKGVNVAQSPALLTVATPVKGTWTYIESVATIPAGYDRFTAYAQWAAVNTPAGDLVYVDDPMVREETASQSIINQLFGGTTVLPSILSGVVPNLDATKITTGQFPQSMLNITSIAAGIVSGVLGTGQIPSLDASKITTGILNLLQIPGLDAGRIPSLDASKITSGQFPQAMLNITSIAAGIVSGVLGTGNIPSLDAAKITTGQFPQAMLNITSIAAGIVSGVLGTGQIPSLDASKIGTGTFADAFLPGLGATRDAIYQAINGGSTTGTTAAQIKAALQNIPGGNIVSALLASVIPSLDVTKITTGVFGTGFIPSLPTSKITSGTFPQSMLDITNIAASIVSGVLGGGQIPALDASKIGTGTFADAFVPGLGNRLLTSLFNQKSTTGSNLVIGSNFEDTTILRETSDGFTTAGYSTDIAHSGTHSWKLRATGNYDTLWFSPYIGQPGAFLSGWHDPLAAIKVQPGEKYYLECWVFSDTDNAPGGGIFTLAHVVNSKTGDTTYPGFYGGGSPPNGVWTKCAGYLTIPAGYDQMYPSFSTSPAIPAGNVYYIDDVVLREVTEAQNITQQLFGGTSVLPSILSNTIPLLDVTKIIGGPFDTGMIPFLNANKITSGTFADAFVPGLANRLLTNVFNQRSLGGSNLVIDPSFEDTTILRPFSGVADSGYSTDQAHSGVHSFKIVADGTGEVDLWLTGHSSSSFANEDLNFKTQPGTKYYAEIWVYAPTSNVGSRVLYYMVHQDSTGVNATTFSNVGGDISVPKGVWTKLSGYITCPTGYDWIRFIPSVRAAPNVAGDVFYWDDAIIREETAAQNITNQLFGGTSVLPSILSGVIPNLDATKITSGQFPQSMLNITSIAAGIVSGVFGVGQIPGLDADQIVTGFFPAIRIPNLDASKIISGTLLAGLIPGLPASRITSGTFDAATQLSGLLPVANVPALPASQITSGIFGTSFIPNLPASIITSGVFSAASMIPSLDASKIGSGSFAQSMIANLGTDLSKLFGFNLTKVTQGSNLASNPGFENTSFVVLPNGAYSTAQKHSGTQSCAMTATATNYPTVYLVCDDTSNVRGIPCQPGDKFYVEYWVYGKATNVNTTDQVWVQFSINNAAGASVGTVAPFPNLVAGTALNGVWTKYSGYVTMPAGAASAIPYLVVGNTIPAGNVYYFDDVVIREETATQNITNQLFGGTSVLPSILSGVVPSLDASKIGSGTFSDGFVPGLFARLPTADFDARMRGGSNLIVSPDFEDTWVIRPNVQPGSGYSTEQKHSGTQSFKVIAQAGNYADVPLTGSSNFDNEFKVKPGDKFYQEVWVYAPTSNVGTHVMFYTAWDDSARVLGVQFANVGDVFLTKGVWTKLSGYVTVPPGYDRGAFRLSVRNDNNTGDAFYWDDVLVREETAAQTITNQLFGGTSVLPSILAGVIPALSTTQITSGTFADVFVPGLANRLLTSVFNQKAVAGSNLVIDPSFDDPTINRTYGDGSGSNSASRYTTDQSHSGTYSFKFFHTTGYGGLQFDVGRVSDPSLIWNQAGFIAVTPGQKFYCEAWAYEKATNVNTTGTMSVVFSYLDSKNPGSSQQYQRVAELVCPRGVWTKLSGYFTVPAGYDRLAASFGETGTSTANDICYVDDLVLREETASQNIINRLFGGTSVLPAVLSGVIPALDASVIQSGTIPIGQIPTSQLGRNNISDIGSTLDQITNALVGAGQQFFGTDTTQARASMDRIYNDTLIATQSIQALRSDTTGADVSGLSVNINFNTYPDGTLPSMFTIVYSGTGTSTIGVSSGQAGWRVKNNDGNRNALISYNTKPTNTDFQIVRGTLASAPPGSSSGGTPRIAAVGRIDNPANPQNYVWARGYCTGFLTYKGDIGCTVAGVDTVWVSNIPLTWSMDISMVLGVNNNPRRYQVFSGTTLVYDYTEVGTASMLGAAYRYWGCRTEIKTGGSANPSPSIASTSVSDAAPPLSVGSGAVIQRTSTGGLSLGTGAQSGTRFPNNMFDTNVRSTADMTVDLTGNSITASIPGWYLITARINKATAAAWGFTGYVLHLWKNGARYQDSLQSDVFVDSNTYGPNLGGVWMVYADVGDMFQLGFSKISTGINNPAVSGGATQLTFFTMSLMNRSLA